MDAKDSRLRVLHFRLTGLDHLHRDVRSEAISHARERGGQGKECPCGCWAGSARPSSPIDGDLDLSATWEEESVLSCESPITRPCPSPDTSEAAGDGSGEVPEVLDFADWAFGPTGLPRLEVMAFGDFTHEGRHWKQSFVVRRKRLGPSSFCNSRSASGLSGRDGWFICIGDVNEPSFWSDVGYDGSLFLSACPDGDLMESPDEW